MASGLFDSLPAAGTDVRRDDPAPDGYRALSGPAIVAGVLALLSPLAFVDWWLLTVPLLGAVLGVVALRDIARRPTALTGRPLAIVAVCVSIVMCGGGLAYLSHVYASELPEGFERLDYGVLQPLPGDPDDRVPESAMAFDGRNVLLKGYMYPGKQQEGITQFLLVRDQGDCCFGGNPKITDRVLVQLDDPRGIGFSQRLTKIAGTFRVRRVGGGMLDDGVLYHLEHAVVR